MQLTEVNLVARGGYKTNGKDDFSVESFTKWIE